MEYNACADSGDERRESASCSQTEKVSGGIYESNLENKKEKRGPGGGWRLGWWTDFPSLWISYRRWSGWPFWGHCWS